MIFKILTFTTLLVSINASLFAQVFAQEKTYFQQQVNYNIDVRLDDIKHELEANVKIEYTNNSPDKLDFI